MTLAAVGRRALRSPMVWAALLMVALAAAATLAAGVALYRSTEVPMTFDRR